MRVRMIVYFGVVLVLLLLALLPGAAVSPTGWTVVAWNNLGMHCMDAGFDVFAILPPYNTIQAHVVDASGHLVKSGTNVKVTYEAVADPTGSINTTSRGKTDFWDNVVALFGATLPVDAGLAGRDMPGSANTPKAMTFDASRNWFIAEGIPITPYDDSGKKNPYPMMKVTARDASGSLLASTRIVLPVSDEMDCRTCHASGRNIRIRRGCWSRSFNRRRSWIRSTRAIRWNVRMGPSWWRWWWSGTTGRWSCGPARWRRCGSRAGR